jgi:hypothetical protein
MRALSQEKKSAKKIVEKYFIEPRIRVDKKPNTSEGNTIYDTGPEIMSASVPTHGYVFPSALKKRVIL